MGSKIFKIGNFPLNCVVNTVLRTGAAHPLLNFRGCGRTRRTRSNEAPENQSKNDNLCMSAYVS